MTPDHLHPRIAAAADGELPEWSVVEPGRLRHLAAVARLMGEWADSLALGARERGRWEAAGWLHDALRDADPETLAAEAGSYPGLLRHGPAAAERLKAEGVDDDELLEAIRYHSLGCAGLRRLGRFLFLADYLDPTRGFEADARAELRSRLPSDLEDVLRVVCAKRIAHQLERGNPLLQESVDFWNELAQRRG